MRSSWWLLPVLFAVIVTSMQALVAPEERAVPPAVSSTGGTLTRRSGADPAIRPAQNRCPLLAQPNPCHARPTPDPQPWRRTRSPPRRQTSGALTVAVGCRLAGDALG